MGCDPRIGVTEAVHIQTMIPSSNPQMPMGRSILPLNEEDLMPLRTPPGASGMPPPPPSAAGMIQGPSGGPLGAPQGSAKPPYEVVLQPDGSSVYQIPPPTPGGQPIILAVNKPPKLPPALQPKNIQQPPI